MNYYLIRHARVELAGVCYGTSDVAAPELDVQAVTRLKAELPAVDSARMYTSPLTRCKQLACQLWPEHQWQVSEAVKELHFGDWEGSPWSRVPRAELDAWAARPMTFSPPNGESFKQLIDRVASWRREVNALARSDGAENIVLVTHAGVIKAMNVLVNGHCVRDAIAASIPHVTALRI
ncbi:MAG TPA: histidine phosphatase family protein [Marinagarivorans sp.]